MKTTTENKVTMLFVVYECVRAVTGSLLFAGSLVAGAIFSVAPVGSWRVEVFSTGLLGMLGAWQVLRGSGALWKMARSIVERDPTAS